MVALQGTEERKYSLPPLLFSILPHTYLLIMAVWYQRLVWAEDDKGSWRLEDRTCGTAGRLLSHGWAREKSSNDDPNSLLPHESSVCLRHHQRAITVAAWANKVFPFPMVWIGMAREVQCGVPLSKFLHFPADRRQPQCMHGSACFVATHRITQNF